MNGFCTDVGMYKILFFIKIYTATTQLKNPDD